MPRSRLENSEWVQTHAPTWDFVWDRPNPRYRDGPRDFWYVYRAPLPSVKLWAVVWVWSTLFTRAPPVAAAQEYRRRKRAAHGACQRLLSARVRLRGAAQNSRHLYVHLPGRFPADFSMPYISTETGEDLAKKVAEKVYEGAPSSCRTMVPILR